MSEVTKSLFETPNVVSKYDYFYEYEYNAYTNPGPLAEIDGKHNLNFYGGRYNSRVLTEDTIYYRGGDETNPFGRYFTEYEPNSVAQIRIDSAVKPQWINVNGELTGISRINIIYEIKIPAGTTIYEGPVGYQGGVYFGRMNKKQVFILEPWKGGEVLNKKSIK